MNKEKKLWIWLKVLFWTGKPGCEAGEGICIESAREEKGDSTYEAFGRKINEWADREALTSVTSAAEERTSMLKYVGTFISTIQLDSEGSDWILSDSDVQSRSTLWWKTYDSF